MNVKEFKAWLEQFDDDVEIITHLNRGFKGIEYTDYIFFEGLNELLLD